MKGDENLKNNEVRPAFRKIYFPHENLTYWQAKESLLTFAFVREPFERIVSSYNNKMLGITDLFWMRKEILLKLVNFQTIDVVLFAEEVFE